jgi:alginate O-acetyltransferase complex protein AlgI
MAFNSLQYVLFLAIVFVAFWAMVRARVARTVLLLVASWIFYMSWNATFVLLIVGSTVLDYWVGLSLGRTDSKTRRRWLLWASLGGNLGVLCLFKYTDFCIEAVTEALIASGLAAPGTPPPYLDLVLPVGISFYTFQTLSYTIDVYRRKLEPTRNFLEFATFVAFFPQLVAGPIVRASELLPQFDTKPDVDTDRAGNGVFLILKGLTKKVVIADFLAANYIDRVWDDPGAWSSGEVWVATAAYTWQLYYDFSGYTDIARGSAKLFGFELPENFHRPLQSTSVADFWNRWHITLSTWIRDYVYIPLGGSRQGKARKYVNIFVAFILCGLWHGAGWTFLFFALWHASWVTITHVLRDATGRSDADATGVARWVLIALNNLVLLVHWPTFRSPDTDTMLAMYSRMLAGDWVAMRVPWAVWLMLAAAVGWHLTPESWTKGLRAHVVRLPAPAQTAFVVVVSALIVWVGSGQAAPFVYFQF